MTDETDTVRRIVVDCIDAELRFGGSVSRRRSIQSPLVLAEKITDEIMLQLKNAGIRTIRESFPLGGDG